jgi:hypothetical protein
MGIQAIDGTTTTATVKCPIHANAVLVECTADSTFTCTVEGQMGQDGDWIQIPCTHSDGGTFAAKAAGATITLTDGDLLLIACPGMYQVRVKRAGGTASVRMTATAASIDAFLDVIQQSGSGSVVAYVVGNTAHDAADGGNPIKIGAKAETSISGVTLVADGDRTDLHAGVDGVLITRPHCNLEDNLTGTVSNTDGNRTAIIAAQASGIKTYLTALDLYNSSAAAVVVDLEDGTTVKKSFLVPATSGLIRYFNPPLAGTAATAWNINAASATTTIYANAEGFKSKV